MLESETYFILNKFRVNVVVVKEMGAVRTLTLLEVVLIFLTVTSTTERV